MFANNHGNIVLPADVSVAPDAAAAAYVPKGAIGVGTWSTQAEFKDIKVTHNDETLFRSDFTGGTQGWSVHSGDWTTHDGVLAQGGGDTDERISAGDPSWTDYTYELTARKTGGAEGFLVLFHVRNPDNYIWFNVGGWNNTRTVMEKAENGAKAELGTVSDLTVVQGQWYDVKIEVEGQDIRCYVDGKLTCQGTDTPGAQPDPVYANATRDPASGDVFLHVVNVSGTPRSINVNLQGVTKVTGDATCEVLTGDPDDVNSLAEPEKIVPTKSSIAGLQPSFTHEFPAHSVTVLRLPAQ
jgi:alpha-L-arabinofuranosidase